MQNENRSVFGISGISGMLIATILLLFILVVLTIWGIKTQQNVMQNPYTLEKADQVQMFGSDPKEHIKIKE